MFSHLIPGKRLFFFNYHIRFSLILIFYSFIAFSQPSNLVTNPSFENYVDFDNSSVTSNWKKCLKNDTPDYIEFSARGKPDFYYRKYIGGLLPYDGDAYIGIFCYRINPLRGIDNVREFVQAPLVSTLEKDTVYTISLMIALDPESTKAINNFNIYFGLEEILFKKEKQLFELKPQLSFKGKYLDSITWMKLENTYKARGNESRIVLGNFLPDDRIAKKNVSFDSRMLEKWNLHELEQASYYYIDMVSVVKTSELTSGTPGTDTVPEFARNNVPEPSADFPVDINSILPDSSIVLNNIYFEFDKSQLLPESYSVLDYLFQQLQKYPDLLIVIEGHTDNMGTFEYNMNLSVARAGAVVDYLLQKGLSEDRVTYEGFGYTRPVSDNRDETGRQLNRRVAFRIIGSEKADE